jgi:hypothetical protein
MKRGNTYWHRASIPADIRSTYPKTEETFSLGTKEPLEAMVRVRRAAAEVDQRFAVHRRQQALLGSAPIAQLTKAHLARIEELYYSHLLDEDEQVRLEGFYEPGEPLPNAPVPSFEEYAAGVSEFGGDARHMLARGKRDEFYRQEVEEVLTWNGLGCAWMSSLRAGSWPSVPSSPPSSAPMLPLRLAMPVMWSRPLRFRHQQLP